MAAFLVDEDLPRSLAVALREHGFAAADVRDVGLRGSPDVDVFRYAKDHQQTLITADLGFANDVTFPAPDHHGFVLCRFPNNVPAPMLVANVVRALDTLVGEDLQSSIVVVEPGQVRIRRA